MRISELPESVTASKVDWTPNVDWLGFTPGGGDASAWAKCQSTVNRQFGHDYVIEYITETFSKPTKGFWTIQGMLRSAETIQHSRGASQPSID